MFGRRDCSRFFSIAANDPMARNLRVKIVRHDHSHCTRSLRIAGLGRDLFVSHRFALGNFFHDRAHTVRKALLFFRHRQPSIQPSSRNRCTKAPVRWFCAERVSREGITRRTSQGFAALRDFGVVYVGSGSRTTKLKVSPPRPGDNLKTAEGRPRGSHAVRAAILAAGAACFRPKWPALNARWPISSLRAEPDIPWYVDSHHRPRPCPGVGG